MNEPKYAIATEMRKKDGAQNQDCGAAERLLMADGNFAYVAAIADGVSCCEMPREAASLAISHFRRAMEDTSLQELSNASLRPNWLKTWNDALDDDIRSRVRDGYATFCALAVIPFPGETGYGVLSLNVGDSSSFLVSAADSRCVSMKPSDGGRRNSGDDGLMRGVGLSHRDGPLMDMDWRTYPAGFSGYFWVGCDGVFNYVAGSDLREISLGGKYAFRELPQGALAASMAEGRRQRKRVLDNATAAVVGVNVPESPLEPEEPPAHAPAPHQPILARLRAIADGIPLWALAAALGAAVVAAVALWVAGKPGCEVPAGGGQQPAASAEDKVPAPAGGALPEVADKEAPLSDSPVEKAPAPQPEVSDATPPQEAVEPPEDGKSQETPERAMESDDAGSGEQNALVPASAALGNTPGGRVDLPAE